MRPALRVAAASSAVSVFALRPLTANAEMDRRPINASSQSAKYHGENPGLSRRRAGVFEDHVGGFFADHD